MFWNPLSANAGYENYYTFNQVDTMHTATGQTTRIQSSVIEINYQPPVGVSGLDPDPSDFDALLHDVRFTYEVQDLPTVTNRVTTVSTPTTARINSSQGITIRSNATGNFGLKIAKLNAAGNAIESTYNFTNQTFEAIGEGSGNVSTETFAASDESNIAGIFEKEFSVVIPSNGAGTYSVICSAGTLPIGSTAPDAINELNFTVLDETGNQTFTPGTKTNLASSGSTTIHSNIELTEMGSKSGLKTFTFTYTKQSGTMTLDRQPNSRDFVGSLTKAYVDSDQNSGVTTLPIADTTGIKVGMIATNASIPAGTKVATVNTNTSVVLAVATNATLPQAVSYTHLTLPTKA